MKRPSKLTDPSLGPPIRREGYEIELEKYADFLEQIVQSQEEIIELWNMWFDKMEEEGRFDE